MTPLFKKLNLGDANRILVLNAPESFDAELDRLDSIKVVRRATAKTRAGFAMGFATTEAERDSVCNKLVNAAAGDAIVWLAYPKKTSKNYTCEFNRDAGWKIFGDAGFEGVRQVAIDSDWSALRFRRTEFIKSMTRRNSMAISAAGKRRTRTQ